MQKVTPFDLRPASYNPRLFTDANRDSLGESMEEFGDISGITFNSLTGNLVTGHHRWEQICNKHGIQNIKLESMKGTDCHYVTDLGGKRIGFLVRVVEWNIDKEKLANVTANSPTVRGEFTDKLQDILETSKFKFEGKFKSLQLGTLADIKVSKPKIATLKKSKKSETIITASGEKYRTVKLELSPSLADLLHDTINMFKEDGESVEKPIKMILDYIRKHDVDDIRESLNETKRRSRVRRVRRNVTC